MLQSNDRTNFDTLIRAFEAGHVALVEIQRIADQKTAAALCAMNLSGSEFEITLFAVMVEGNPLDLFNPPNPQGGFFATAVGT